MNFVSNRALTEGWDLFSCNGLLQIQRLSRHDIEDLDFLAYTEPKFVDDRAAVYYVHMNAALGSEYHRQALSLVGASSKELR